MNLKNGVHSEKPKAQRDRDSLYCLCRYAEVIYGEIDLHQKREQVRSAGDKWLNNLSEAQRAQVLGIKGAEAWENGGDWREFMRGYAGFRENKSRLQNMPNTRIIRVGHVTLYAEPNSITEIVREKGGIERNYYAMRMVDSISR